MNLTTERIVSRPVPEVFARFTDLSTAAERIKGIEELEVLTEGPIRVGTRFRETRIMFRRPATEEMEITAFEKDEMYTISCDSCGCHYETVFRFRWMAVPTPGS